MSGRRSPLGARLAELQLALMLLTRVPVGRIGDPAPALAAACWAFPLAGLLVGAVAALVLAAALSIGLPAPVAAGLSLTAGVLATGAMHEDGLADVADGLGGGKDREHRLAIMRDSRIGAYGALALILVVGLRWTALATLAGQDALRTALAVLAIAAASRSTVSAALLLLPAARADGLGHAASATTVPQTAVAIAIGGAALTALGIAAALAVVLAQAVALLIVARLALRRVGGHTGDVLGALQQAAELSAWLVLVVLAR